MRDHDHRTAELFLELLDQGEDLCLRRHVERGGRLVGDQQVRVVDQRHRDHHALAHAARELVGIVVEPAGRIRNADKLQHLERTLAGGLTARIAVDADRLGNLRPDGVDRIEARHRLLEDHRDAIAANAAHLALVESSEILPPEAHGAADDASDAARQQPQDRECSHTLAAARLADDADGLAGKDLEGDAVDRASDAVLVEEVGPEITDLEQRRDHTSLTCAARCAGRAGRAGHRRRG